MKPINVLSLFDGISCGKIALEKIGIPINKYYASEVENNAIKISKKNYPDIIQLGDVTNWRKWNIDWNSIDLLIGGSPCQGFSRAGKQLNFKDPRSKLFFEYVDILNHLKKFNPNIKFLLENVDMKQEYVSVINSYLKVEPITINSRTLSAQNRKRLYWTNWEIIPLFEDSKEVIKDILLPIEDVSDNFFHKTRTIKSILNSNFAQERKMLQNLNDKCSCLLARDYKDPKCVVQNGRLRKLTPIEYERLQTVPDNYTEGVSNTQRYKMLGNGWTANVISYILSFIKKDFEKE